MTHEDYKEMLSSHALGALGENEARSLEEHLSSCASCVEELREWYDASAALAFSTDVIEPDVTLRAKILDKVKTLGNEKRPLIDQNEPTGGPTSASNVLEFVGPERPRWSSGFTLGAIAASLVFVVLTTAVFVLWRRSQALLDQLTREAMRVNETRVELERQRTISEILSNPHSQSVLLLGTDSARQANGRFSFDPQTGRAVLVANNLPVAPTGKAYQLWFIADGKPVPGGVFRTDQFGRATIIEQVPAEGRKATTFAITLEPQEGVKAPTGAMYLKS
jgi:anti-sigma-K factor RskA